MAALSFGFGTIFPMTFGLILVAVLGHKVWTLVRLWRAPMGVAGKVSVPLWLPVAVACLWAWNVRQLYQVHQCEKYGDCGRAPTWCRDGLGELRARPHGCRDWGPVGCHDETSTTQP